MQPVYERDNPTHAAIFAASPIIPGKQYRFAYPVEFTSLDEYSKRRGQTVTVLRACDPTEANVLWDDWDGSGTQVADRMFKVQASDGWIGDAWETELEEI